MIFQETWRWVVWQSVNTKLPKTQTRRLVKNGEYGILNPDMSGTYTQVLNANRRILYEVGHTYPVIAARCLPMVHIRPDGLAVENVHQDKVYMQAESYKSTGYRPARVRITRIRREDVRGISNEDRATEGFQHARDFLHMWLKINDPTLHKQIWGEKALYARPLKYYEAWVYDFEFVGERAIGIAG
jgi:Txe/YoeB family toxin of Txe-Axe toxin-antitoxin module